MKRPSLEHLAAVERIFDEFMRSLPPGIKLAEAEVKQNLDAVLNSALDRMELVTREEFDVQSEVLKRTREKLEAMEQRLAELEREAN